MCLGRGSEHFSFPFAFCSLAHLLSRFYSYIPSGLCRFSPASVFPCQLSSLLALWCAYPLSLSLHPPQALSAHPSEWWEVMVWWFPEEAAPRRENGR